jgi:hypothetical protein
MAKSDKTYFTSLYIILHSGHHHPTGFKGYLFDIREQIRQDFFLVGNNIPTRLKPAHSNITTNATPNAYAPGSIPQVVVPPLACMIPAHDDGMNTKR